MIHGHDIHFAGVTEEQFFSRDDSHVSVLSGTNNCGKSLILKLLFNHFGEKGYLCGTNRYYSLEHFTTYQENPRFIADTWEGTRTQIGDARCNHDPVVMQFHDVFIRLTDDERVDVYRICSDRLELGSGMSIDLMKLRSRSTERKRYFYA